MIIKKENILKLSFKVDFKSKFSFIIFFFYLKATMKFENFLIFWTFRYFFYDKIDFLIIIIFRIKIIKLNVVLHENNMF